MINSGFAGLLLGILCPPLLPLTGGVALVAAMETWNAEVEGLSRANAKHRDAQIRHIREKRMEAISRLTGGETAGRVETGHLSVLVDGETGAMDGTILTGPRAGQAWSTLGPKAREEERARLTKRGDSDSLTLLSALGLAAA